MVRVATFFAMTFGAFLFWQSMDRVHVWIALHQDEKKERMERELEIKKMQAELMAQAKEIYDTCYFDNKSQPISLTSQKNSAKRNSKVT
ncbi:hypothetical protein ABZP36_017493 [Zizania latifolia]